MGREEQVEEREVLDSIFPEEITGTYSNMRPFGHSLTHTSRLQIYQTLPIE